MNSGKIVAGRVDGTEIEGSIRGPRRPKKTYTVELEEHHQEEMTIQDRPSNQVSIRILI